METFEYNGETYSYVPAYEIIDGSVPIESLIKNLRGFNSGYAETALSFDIETTSFYSAKYDANLATMYHWQVGLDGTAILGRYWEEFLFIIQKLNDYFQKRELIVYCWVQNLSFEFQFIKAWFKWNTDKNGKQEIFAKDIRTVLYARTGNIEFRDSLALTAMPLRLYKKNFGLDIGKLDGDLDYSLKRHNRSKMEPSELAYCINDVLVLNEWHNKYIIPFYLELEKKVPLTSTGIVRAEVKEEFNSMDKKEKNKMRFRLKNAQPSEEIYKLWRYWLFRGGLVHANTIACNYLVEELFASLDLKSAHPSAMLEELFPWKFNRRNKEAFSQVLEASRSGKTAFFGVFKFYDIQASGWHCLESKNKIIEYSPDCYFENGRLAKGHYIKVCLNELDFYNYEDLYKWSKCECTILYESEKKPLPEYVRKIVVKYFVNKETIPKDTPEYNLSKRKLNSLFGMAATSLPEHEIVLDEYENILRPGAVKKSYEELTKFLVMLPQWAIWIAAYTRRSIVRSLKVCGIDSIYYDTDSNKIRDYEKYKSWFEEFNREKMEKNKLIDTFGYDPKYISKIGIFDYEYSGIRYKVLGAKRYLVQKDNGELQVTVAGMVKGTLEKYCESHYKAEDGTIKAKKETDDPSLHLDIWETFSDDLRLSPEDSEKQTALYYDKHFTEEITDYNGITAPVEEYSSVAIIDIPFDMSIESEFINRIEALRQERENAVYKGVL